jgi:hypothetical protein
VWQYIKNVMTFDILAKQEQQRIAYTHSLKQKAKREARKDTLLANVVTRSEVFFYSDKIPAGAMTTTEILTTRRENERWAVIGWGYTAGSNRSRFAYDIYMQTGAGAAGSTVPAMP